ncbi:MAG: type II secretion system protein N [Henriciella sp.]|nr:type II secretion system protein N [Henriciella sp.]
MPHAQNPVIDFAYRIADPARRGLEIIFAVLLAVLLARLIWMVAAPAGSAGTLQPRPLPAMLNGSDVSRSVAADRSLLVRLNPFATDRVEAIPEVPETQLNLQLVGLLMSTEGPLGSAIIQTPDGQSGRYAPGEEILPGVTLDRVLSDRVILIRNGVSETLMRNGRGAGLSVIGDGNQVSTATRAGSLDTVDAQEAGTSSASRVSAEGRIANSEAFLRDVAMSPVERDDRLFGYAFNSRGSEQSLTEAGLEAGDILLGVNGNSIEGTSIAELVRQLGDSESAILLIERNGTTQTLRLDFEE